MNTKNLVEYFGSAKAAYTALGVSKQAFCGWKRDGIPPVRKYQVEVVTAGKLKAEQKA
jgi:hypothetical protein